MCKYVKNKNLIEWMDILNGSLKKPNKMIKKINKTTKTVININFLWKIFKIDKRLQQNYKR